MNPKSRFLFPVVFKALLDQGYFCPACGCKNSTVCDTKYKIVSLRRCNNCKLLFRAPTATLNQNEEFYQTDYKQGYTTELPSLEELKALLEIKFAGTERDYSDKIGVLKSLGCQPGSLLFEFGCSWGYGSWQLEHNGFDVVAFDVSKPRVDYARRNLAVKTVRPDELYGSCSATGCFDVFFSSHVIEHVPSPARVFDLAFHLLKPDGMFVAFTPNGSLEYRRQNPLSWHHFWGFVHTNLLDDTYYDNYFARVPRLFAAAPYDLDRIRLAWLNNQTKTSLDLDGSELLFVAKKEKSLISDWSF